MSKITLRFMQRFMGNLDSAIRNFVDGKLGDLDSHIGDIVDDKMEDVIENMNDYVDEAVGAKQDKPIIKSANLAAGSTSVTFTGLPTTGFNMIDVYTTIPNLDYEDMEAPTASSLTITYEAQSVAVIVYLKIEVIE